MKIISFEGVEGVGKTTIITSLLEKLKDRGLKVEYYKEPMFFREEIFSKSIEDYEYLFLLFSASRKKMLENINKEADLVIIERYIDSTLVYQFLPLQLKGKTLELKFFTDFIENIIFEGNKDLYPLITFVLVADKKDLRKRKITKTFDTNDDLIQKQYCLLPYLFPKRMFVYLNTSKRSKEKIVEEVLWEIERVLQKT